MRTWLRPLALLFAVLLAAAGCGSPEEEGAAGDTDVQVRVGALVTTTLHAYVDAYGTVAPEPSAGARAAGAARLAAPSAGLIREVPVSEGQTVHAGDLVVRLDDRMARAGVDRARAALTFAEADLDRRNALVEQGNASRRQVAAAREAVARARADLTAARGALAQVQLRTPIDGIVSRVNVLPGQPVDLNTVVAEVVDPARMTVAAGVPVGDVARVRAGQPASVRPAGFGKPTPGRVSFVSPAADPNAGTVLVRLSLPDSTGLRPGTFVEVRIAVEAHADCLAAPRESVYTDPTGRSTLSVVRNDTAYRQEVRTGLAEGDLVEVQGEGLRAGMTVVTVGSYALPPKTRVSVLPVDAQRGDPR